MSSLTQMLRLSDMRLSGDLAVLNPRSHLFPHLWRLNKLGWRVWDYYWSQTSTFLLLHLYLQCMGAFF